MNKSYSVFKFLCIYIYINLYIYIKIYIYIYIEREREREITIWYFFNNLFRCNTLFTYTINNIPFTIDIHSMCFLGLMKTCKFWMPGCSAVGDRLTSPLCTTSGRLRNFDTKCHPTETRFNQIRCGKINKIKLCLLCCGLGGGVKVRKRRKFWIWL